MKISKMKISILVICLGLSQILHAQKKILIPQLNNKKVLLQTGQTKATTYYSLSKKYGTVLRIGGPGELTIFLRTRMATGETSDNPYNLRYILDGKIVIVKPT